MNVGSWMLWGFVATVALTTALVATQELRLTRVNIPFLLGSMFTPVRARAKALGTAVHMVNGWLFSLLYVAAFQAWGKAGLWRGMVIGLLHAAFVLVAGLPALPGIHPRMAHDSYGPTARRQLEPPGYLGLHYGALTPVTVLFAHLLFGAILGAFYRLR
ncbi:MAG TPA: hypothetical protein VND93_32270 [Myxococcales bacterium]|jgi:uncharacterized membrane protein YagU involved in acid resistance|nr:hypothetical protein [Myxococcales bacterium]